VIGWLEIVRDTPRPASPADGDDEDELDAPRFHRKVVSRFRRQWIEGAAELWDLVDPARASAIRKVYDDVAARTPSFGEVRFGPREIGEFSRLLDGLEPALQGRLINEKLETDLALIDELRPRLPTLDMAPTRSPRELQIAIAEGIVAVEGLKRFFDEALELGLDVVVAW